MNRAAEQLLRLQEADDSIDRLGKEVGALEASLAGDAELDRLRAAAADAAESQRAGDLRVRALDGEVESMRARLKTLDRQLYGGSVRNPAELLTLQHELEDVRAKLSAQEDDTLQAMEEAEAAASARQEADLLVREREASRQQELGPLAERLGRVRQQLVDAQASRELVASGIPESSLALYRRVAAKRTPAVARVVSATCGGCHLPLGAREVHAARMGDELVQCSNCDRILAP